MSSQIFVQVARSFTASAERVFDAWLDPERVRKFLFATPTGEIVRAEVDARVGGRFMIVDRRDGLDAEHAGEYLEIERPRRLVFAFWMPQHSEDRSIVTIDIVPTETGCVLTLTHELHPDYAEYREQTRKGWTTILESLDTAVEG
jgi:uncharacterized protein YndB with AHSA1/START domain